MSRLRSKLTFANVIAASALFVALGGGAYATHSHKIGTKDLRNGAVKTKKLGGGAVGTGKIKANAVTPAKVRNLNWRDLDVMAPRTADADNPPQFAKDVQGVVHLRGIINGPGIGPSLPDGPVATLPPAFRPSGADRSVWFANICFEGGSIATSGFVFIDPGTGVLGPGGAALSGNPCDAHYLDGITFMAN